VQSEGISIVKSHRRHNAVILGMTRPFNWPFHDKAEDAIVMFHLLTHGMHQQTCILKMYMFMFIMHRCALLVHIPAVQHTCPPFCITPKTTPMQVPWDVCGVSVTWWFEDDPALMCWITTTAGQHSVTMEDGAPTPVIV
jgi:hypothetical protein